MDSNWGESSNKHAKTWVKEGSVFPKPREKVSTMMGKKMAEIVSKAIKSTSDAFKKSKKKGEK